MYFPFYYCKSGLYLLLAPASQDTEFSISSPFMQNSSLWREPWQTSLVALPHSFPRHAAILDCSHVRSSFQTAAPAGPHLSLPPSSLSTSPWWSATPCPAPVHPALPVPRPLLMGQIPDPFTFTASCPISYEKKKKGSHKMSHFFSLLWA